MQWARHTAYYRMLIQFVLVSITFCLLLVLHGCTVNKTAMPNTVQPSLSGRLLIDISDHKSNLYGFLLQLPDWETTEVYKQSGHANDANLEILQHPNYKEIFDAERWYNHKMDKQLKDTFSAYNIEKAFQEASDRKWSKHKGERYFLSQGAYNRKGAYSSVFYPNRRFSFIAYLPCPCTPLLIDSKTKEVFFPFDHDRVETLVWDKSGRNIAYTALQDFSYQTNRFVIKNAVEGETILRKELAAIDGIADVAFSPDAKRVAVISYTKRPGFWPHEILLQSSGHGIFYHTYYLEIYDMSGRAVFKKTLSGSYKNSAAHIVWIE